MFFIELKYMNLAIIGCGEIGRRHLQSVLNLDIYVNIILVDRSNECLEKCRNIIKISSSKIFFSFYSNIEQIIQKIDFAIIATNSDTRFEAINSLYNQSKPKYIILEKFLFNKLEQYSAAKNLFKINSTKVWVNQWVNTEFVEFMKIFRKYEINNIEIKGKNWNLCSNSVHYIDWFHLVSKRKKIKVIENKFKKPITKNKRVGFYEFYGYLKLEDSNKKQLLLKCDFDKDGVRKTYVNVLGNTIRAECELTENCLSGKLFFQDRVSQIEYKINYLSERMSVIIEEIINKDNCSLPNYDQSCYQHKMLYPFFMDYFNTTSFISSDSLPIT